MDNVIFTIETTMLKEDYRKFLYIATFRRSNTVLPLIAIISLLGALLIAFQINTLNLVTVILLWLLFLALSVGAVCFKVERKNKQRIRTDKSGTFDSKNTLNFCDDKLTIEAPATNGTNTLNYNQFYQVLESSDYFIFYFNINLASLLCKRDISNVDEFRAFIKPKFAGKYKNV